MAMKKSVWDMILKVVIAVASAVAGDEFVRQLLSVCRYRLAIRQTEKLN